MIRKYVGQCHTLIYPQIYSSKWLNQLMAAWRWYRKKLFFKPFSYLSMCQLGTCQSSAALEFGMTKWAHCGYTINQI